jgi:hypothetical protein
MAEFIARWFTPSDSDQQSGAQYNAAYNAQSQAQAARAKKKEVVPAVAGKARQFKKTQTAYGGLLGQDADTSKKTLLGA